MKKGHEKSDRQGSAIFDRITEQPEYYLTRTEARILADNASERVNDFETAQCGI
jgi:uncharacterized SAM-dependent methyltransferase